MKWEYRNYEEQFVAVYDTEDEAQEALCATRSVDAEILRIPESLEEFIELCREKYGQDVNFCLIAEVEDPHDYCYWGPEEMEVKELYEALKDLRSKRRTYLEEIYPVLNHKRKIERYVDYSDYPTAPVQPRM